MKGKSKNNKFSRGKKSAIKDAKSPKYTGGESRDKRNEMGIEVTNDIAWYAHYPDITLNAGKLSMLYPGGAKLDFLRDEMSNLTTEDDEKYFTSVKNIVHGVMSLEYVPTYGHSDSIRSPLTQMSRSLFNRLVAATNRVPDYEYTDLTMYQIAMTNLVQFYYWAARIYLIAGTYDPYNLNWNVPIFYGLKVDGDDIKRNRSLLYSYLINFAHRISAFPFPKSFDLFSRTAQLASNVYKDAMEGRKDQLYIFNPVGFYYWVDNPELGSSLVFMPTPSKITYDEIVNIGENLLNAMSGSTDIQKMTADILKVYADELVSVNPVPENGRIEAVYDATILTQIMNARIAPGIPEGLNIMQYTDGAALEPYLSASPFYSKLHAREVAGNALKPMVNFLVPNPSEGTVVEGTRFKFEYGAFDAMEAEPRVWFESFGTEILVGARIVNMESSGNNSSYVLGSSMYWDDLNADRLATAITAFDWHPRISVFTKDTNGGTYTGDIWDCSNYAFLTKDQIILMNNAALANLMLIYG